MHLQNLFNMNHYRPSILSAIQEKIQKQCTQLLLQTKVMFTPKGSKFPGSRTKPGSRSGTPLSGAGPRRTVGTPLLTGRIKQSGPGTPVSSRSQVRVATKIFEDFDSFRIAVPLKERFFLLKPYVLC